MTLALASNTPRESPRERFPRSQVVVESVVEPFNYHCNRDRSLQGRCPPVTDHPAMRTVFTHSYASKSAIANAQTTDSQTLGDYSGGIQLRGCRSASADSHRFPHNA